MKEWVVTVGAATGNLKPFVALAFALALAVVGAWASVRAPWPRGGGRRSVLTAFAAFALPFLAVELLTGLVPPVAAALSIPPAIGVGAIVDGGLLAAGLVVHVLRVLRTTRAGPSTST